MAYDVERAKKIALDMRKAFIIVNSWQSFGSNAKVFESPGQAILCHVSVAAAGKVIHDCSKEMLRMMREHRGIELSEQEAIDEAVRLMLKPDAESDASCMFEIDMKFARANDAAQQNKKR